MGYGNRFEQLFQIGRLCGAPWGNDGVERAQYRFESQRDFALGHAVNRTSTMHAISRKVVKPGFGNNNSPDDMLWAIVDVCVSNVAVLDETGSLIYASRAWSCFELNAIENTGTGSTYFESCRRF